MRARAIGNHDVVLIKDAFERGDSLSKISDDFSIPRKQIWNYIISQNWERRV